MLRIATKNFSFQCKTVARTIMSYTKRIDAKHKHLFEELASLNVYEQHVVNLSVGTPSRDLLSKCNDVFDEATKHLLNYERHNGSFIFQYGPQLGTARYREKLAEFLSLKYKSTVDSRDLLLNGGATNGLLIILSTLIDYNGVVFVDEVTYMIALTSLSDFESLKIVPVKLNDDGVDLEDLEEKVRQHKFVPKDKLFFGCYYTIPAYHNPTGICFSDSVCRALVKLARKYDFMIACDDVYNLLYFDDERPLKRLYEYDDFNDADFKGHVISNGTFSKLLSPGIRVGWIECAPRMIDKFIKSGWLQSGGAVNNYGSGLITSMIELGSLDRHIEETKESLRAQRDAFCDALEKHLPSTCSFLRPAGGYFLWIKLPETCNGEQLVDFVLQNYKIFIIRGTRFSIENKFNNCVRISFAFQPPDVLSNAGKILGEAIVEFLKREAQQ